MISGGRRTTLLPTLSPVPLVTSQTAGRQLSGLLKDKPSPKRTGKDGLFPHRLQARIIDQKHCGSQFTLIWDLTRDSKGNLAFVSRVEGNIITLWHHFFLIQSKTLHLARDNLPFYYPSI